MLNELIIGRMRCPVCGRYFFGNLNLWWCPFCGTTTEGEQYISQSPTGRITTRDENGIAVYTGIHSDKSKAYAPYLTEYAIVEILEKLCEMEEEKENENISG